MENVRFCTAGRRVVLDAVTLPAKNPSYYRIVRARILSMNVDDFLKRDMNRRQFLGNSAINAAGVAAGMVSLGATAATAAPVDRVSIAVIGTRRQGTNLATSLAAFPDVTVSTLCDIDESVLSAASKAVRQVQGTTPRRETDFRRVFDDKSIDAVVIATPDHWHAVMTVLACQAGKDVYVEQPVSHNVREGVQMLAAARKYERIVQTGTQQRSGAHFRSAIDYIHSGQLGNVPLAKAWIVHRRKPIGFQHDSATPSGVDYDLWLGPAAQRPFNANRFHGNWHWFWDYGTGELGNWGVHMLDIARWGLNVGLPTRISAGGGKHHFQDDQETPDTQLVQFSYPGKTVTWEHRLWSSHGIEGRSAAAAFYGEKGTLIVDRGGWKVYDHADTVTADTSEQLQTHLRNFIECIRSRELPTSDIENGHISSTLCHLGNIAYRMRRELQFDPATLAFENDAEANALLRRDYREPWELPEV